MQNHPSARNQSLVARRLKIRRRQAIVMAFFLGPLGLFYTDSFGGFVTCVFALIMSLISPVAGVIITWIACMVWAVIAVNKSHARAKERAVYFSGRS